MPTTDDRNKYEELSELSEQDRQNQLRCIGSAFAIALITASIITIIYLIVR